jgi:UDP-N-acetylmuramoyl-L-alanyl-D-glutamate--2,6-diaminopimelate ligase
MSTTPPAPTRAASPIVVETVAAALEREGLLVERRGDVPTLVLAVTDDSRAVAPGALFIAVKGAIRDGHDFLTMAAEQGAALAIVEDASRTELPAFVVREGRRAAAIAAAAAFGEPARALRIVGVTGTNGKTTTVGMLRHLLDTPEAPCASIGTLGVLLGSAGATFPGGGGLTTPGPVELQRLFRALVDRGVRRVAMEVSSHALHQRRVEGVRFDAGVFTNFTRDHLDYHGTMEEYFSAKSLLVGQVAAEGVVVANRDDAAWTRLPTSRRVVTFSIATRDGDVRAEDVRYGPRGSEWTLCAGDECHRVALPLIGDFNVANALGAAAAAWALGEPLADVAARLSTLPQVPGRLEILHERPTVLRDYAHTPDALERALDAVRPFARERLIVLFGCGGDRDAGKRPLMGAVADRKADYVVVTSDNPRTEDPEKILTEILAGIRNDASRIARIEDRRAAIEHALAVARPDDVVVLAGKGHETYQIRGTTSFPFDEKAIVRELTAGATRG